MAYRFDGVDDRVEFAISPFTGYTFGAGTIALFLKRNTLATSSGLVSLSGSDGSTNRFLFYIAVTSNILRLHRTAFSNGPTLASTSPWYLVVVTFVSGTSAPRFHVHNGTSWSHTNGSPNITSNQAVIGTDRVAVGAKPDGTNASPADIVCAGIKKTDSTDGTVETLSRTSFQAWRDFGFDWLIGFDSSLEAAGVLQDQASPGTGDEVSITGTTAISDPPGWVWASATAPVANFTGTPLSGVAPLNVAFTDISTNVPTSWAWVFGDGGTSTAQNPSHNYTVAGTYTVTLTATNAAGADGETKTGYVVVETAPVANFTATPLSGNFPLTVVFTDTSA